MIRNTEQLSVLAATRPSALTSHPDHLAAGHRVQLYEEDEAIVAAVADSFTAAAAAGHAMLLVATAPHREAVLLELERRRVVLPPGGFRALDAAATLASLVVDGEPDAGRFSAVVGALVRQLGERWGGVSIYGEMVGILWERGQVLSAMRLEELWNRLAAEIDFSLLCGYRLTAGMDVSEFAGVCEAHTDVISA
jgi:hypothetical protein